MPRRIEWSAVEYLQRPRYVRSASQRTVESRIAGVAFREVLTDTVPGQAVLTIEVEVVEELEIAGAFFCLDLPGRDFGDAKVQVMDSLVGALGFLKARYGVEAALFSFNEPETGVEVRQTPAEHVEFLWQMGQRLQARGLATRLLLGDTAHGTPAALMPWQLSTDYSVLRGGGVYGEEGTLEPTQRFWNLKQLGLTPRPAFSLPLASNRREVTSAAFGDLAKGIYALHLVNNGGPRRARLKGLPLALQELCVFVTDATRGMEEGGTLAPQTGRVEFDLPAASYMTLLGRQP